MRPKVSLSVILRRNDTTSADAGEPGSKVPCAVPGPPVDPAGDLVHQGLEFVVESHACIFPPCRGYWRQAPVSASGELCRVGARVPSGLHCPETPGAASIERKPRRSYSPAGFRTWGPPAQALGRCRALPGFGHPVACPAPGGLAELPSQLALRQRSARLEAGAVGGHRSGVAVAAGADGSHRPS
jgi:hypothetical protein